MIIPQEFFTTFNDTIYHDEPHKYYLGDTPLVSVTTLLHKYQEEFQENYWSEIKAKEYRISQRDVLRAWAFINKKGTMKGSAIHDYAENLFLSKVFPYPKGLILDEFGFDPIKTEYNMTQKLVDKFYNDVKGKLIPIRTEMIVYDKESVIGGMLDMLFYNVKMQEYQIWDHKTNKTLSLTSERRLNGSLYLLNDSDLNIYSLQLELYKYIIEKNTGIKLGKSYIIWYSHNNVTYEVIETKDMSYFIKLIINDRMKELKVI